MNGIDPLGLCRMNDDQFVFQQNAATCEAARADYKANTDTSQGLHGCYWGGSGLTFYKWDPFSTVNITGGGCGVTLADGSTFGEVWTTTTRNSGPGCMQWDFWSCDMTRPKNFAGGWFECASGGIVAGNPDWGTDEAVGGCVAGFGAVLAAPLVFGKTPQSQAASGATRIEPGAFLTDPAVLRGATVAEVEGAIPSSWVRGPAARGGGIKFVDPARNGVQIIIEPGWQGGTGFHAGPYVRISTGTGPPVRIPLQGNPELP